MAISAGIGLFLGIIALKDAGVVVASPDTLVTLGNLHAPAALLASGGFVLMVALDRLAVPGALIIGVLAAAGAGVALGVSPFFGVIAAPPSLTPTLLAMDLSGAMHLGLGTVVFVFLFVTLFDNTGTLIGVAHRANLLDQSGRLPRAGRVFATAALGAMGGAALGTSSVTSYIESAAGVKAGGRTGLVGVTVAALFLLTLFVAPLAHSVPVYATAPALLFVACMMARGFAELDWEDVTEYAPAVVTVLAMPLTLSIATGIALGFISYVAVKLLSGRIVEAGPVMSALAALFVLKYAFF
jgi:adenine/guanine/hypoxanthine permease